MLLPGGWQLRDSWIAPLISKIYRSTCNQLFRYGVFEHLQETERIKLSAFGERALKNLIGRSTGKEFTSKNSQANLPFSEFFVASVTSIMDDKTLYSLDLR